MRPLFRSLVILLTCTGIFVASASAYTGIVSVDQTSTAPGHAGSVSVRLRNNTLPIAGLVVPLKYASSDLVVDSISYLGALGSNMARIGSIDGVNRVIKIIIYPDFSSGSINSISAPSGILGTIHYHVNPLAAPQVVSVDSINKEESVGQNVVITTRIEFTDASGLQTLLPAYEPGGITIQSPTDVNDDGSILPTSFEVAQNYPNPFNPTTSLSFSLPRAGNVRVEIFNVLGQSVSTLADERKEAGNHTLTFDAAAFPSGVYFYRVDFEGLSETRKMLLLK